MKLLSLLVALTAQVHAFSCLKAVTAQPKNSLAATVGAGTFQLVEWNHGIACPSPVVGSSVCVVAMDDIPSPPPARPKRQVGPPVAGVSYNYCNKEYQVALTFDDGPGDYTGELLDQLATQGIKATFFVNGNNWNCIYDEKYTSFLIRAHREGHQIGHHTWDHKALAALPDDQVRWEMTQLEDAFLRIFGIIPRYMRPPYGSGVLDKRIEGIMKEMGYVIVGWSLYAYDADFDDENGDGSHLVPDDMYLNTTVPRIKQQIADNYNPGGAYITLNHDVYCIF
ncbi:Carbohydrate esterase 4 protein [Podochytrium sp. JEL0797]|nr:Carbohydrate esterase 4 protein [Podochytrium sp. JEL0797]